MLPGYIMQCAIWWPNEEDPNREKYREIVFIGNIRRIAHYIMKIVQGPIQNSHLGALLDRVGGHIIPDDYKKQVITKIRDPHGNIIKIYDTDRHVVIRLVKDNYCVDTDLKKMLEIISHVKDSNKRNAAFIDDLYKIDGIHKYQRVEQDF